MFDRGSEVGSETISESTARREPAWQYVGAVALSAFGLLVFTVFFGVYLGWIIGMGGAAFITLLKRRWTFMGLSGDQASARFSAASSVLGAAIVAASLMDILLFPNRDIVVVVAMIAVGLLSTLFGFHAYRYFTRESVTE